MKLTSWNPLGLSRPVMGLLYLYLYLSPRLNITGAIPPLPTYILMAWRGITLPFPLPYLSRFYIIVLIFKASSLLAKARGKPIENHCFTLSTKFLSLTSASIHPPILSTSLRLPTIADIWSDQNGTARSKRNLVPVDITQASMGSRWTATHLLHLGARRMRVVNLIPRPLFRAPVWYEWVWVSSSTGLGILTLLWYHEKSYVNSTMGSIWPHSKKTRI